MEPNGKAASFFGLLYEIMLSEKLLTNTVSSHQINKNMNNSAVYVLPFVGSCRIVLIFTPYYSFRFTFFFVYDEILVIDRKFIIIIISFSFFL